MAAAEIFGIGASRIELRVLAAVGKIEQTPIIFSACQCLDNAGILLLLPGLEANGLLSYKEH